MICRARERKKEMETQVSKLEESDTQRQTLLHSCFPAENMYIYFLTA